MLIVSNFLQAVAVVLEWGLNIYWWIVIIGAILSWVRPDPYHPAVRFLNQATEPVFYQIRKRLPVVFGGMDLSPLIVLAAILFLQTFVVNSLFQLARSVN
ncbi:MAG: YggT family protein [Desulfobacter sp.]|nr:MAG: YggT family protein [Desulfobacter sp.]